MLSTSQLSGSFEPACIWENNHSLANKGWGRASDLFRGLEFVGWSLWVIRQWSQPLWDLLASAEQWNMLTQAAEKLVMTALKLKKIQWIVYSGREAFLCVRVALFGSSAALAFLCQMVLTGLLSNSGVWHLVYCYGNEILQLQKGDARDNCRCQVTTCPLSLSVLLNEHFI